MSGTHLLSATGAQTQALKPLYAGDPLAKLGADNWLCASGDEAGTPLAWIAQSTEKGARFGCLLAADADTAEAKALVSGILQYNTASLQKQVVFTLLSPKDAVMAAALVQKGFRRVGLVNEAAVLFEWRAETTLPAVSVMSLSYRHEAFLSQALEGMLSQQASFGFEIVLGDDCSPDKSREVIFNYYSQSPGPFSLWLHDNNLGITGNARFLMERCRGEFIAICECDDYWTYPQKLQKQVDLLREDSAATLCFHDCEMHDEINGKVLPFHEHIPKVLTTRNVLDDWYVPTHAMLFRSASLDRPDWLWTLGNLDYAFQLLLSHRGHFRFIKEKWGVYRVHALGASRQFTDDLFLAKKQTQLLSYFNMHTGFVYEEQIEKGMEYFVNRLYESTMKPWQKAIFHLRKWVKG